MTAPPTSGGMRWMTRAEASDYLRISPRQLDRLGLPRSYAAGTRSPRFLQADLDATMTAGSSVPASNVIAFPKPAKAVAKAIRPAVGAIIANANDNRTWLRTMRAALAA